MSRSLYICYFGLQQPLVQTQVVPYLLELQKDGVEAMLLTFEPERIDRGEEERLRAELAAKGIKWRWLRYHKRPSAIATAFDIVLGAWFVRRIIGRDRIDILHGRVHVPTLMGAVGRKFSRRKPKLLFDIRGFFPEEYTEAGLWPEGGWLYRSAKRIERWLLKESDGFVVLTERARAVLFPESKDSGFDKSGRPVEVIPCCVDLGARFSSDDGRLRNEVRRKLGVEDRFVITHVGALGGLYLTEEIADFLAAAKSISPRTFALFLTQTDPYRIVSSLEQRGFAESDYYVAQVSPADVPGFLAASDVGLSFVKASFATLSRSPTKIPEYLASGTPLIANKGVGDVDDLIAKAGVGVLVEDFSKQSFLLAVQKLQGLEDISSVCKCVAQNEFDLVKVGGKRYRRIYERLLNESIHN